MKKNKEIIFNFILSIILTISAIFVLYQLYLNPQGSIATEVFFHAHIVYKIFWTIFLVLSLRVFFLYLKLLRDK